MKKLLLVAVLLMIQFSSVKYAETDDVLTEPSPEQIISTLENIKNSRTGTLKEQWGKRMEDAKRDYAKIAYIEALIDQFRYDESKSAPRLTDVKKLSQVSSHIDNFLSEFNAFFLENFPLYVDDKDFKQSIFEKYWHQSHSEGARFYRPPNNRFEMGMAADLEYVKFHMKKEFVSNYDLRAPYREGEKKRREKWRQLHERLDREYVRPGPIW